jgi:N-acyl-D-amino-acid deacylase
MHDVVIRGGLVFDGTGAEGREADVAIAGDRIVAVEPPGNAGAGRREIDARGKIVTPGFVDMHTHYDAQASWDPYLTPSGWHGCTTVVMGNCGVGFAPARPDKHDWLIGLMEGVEDIPGAAMHEGIRWGWESFPEFLDVLAAQPRALDIGAQVPHCPVRAYVMGERANEANATAEEVAAMAAIVEGGLRAGALGFSTSRTSLHKTIEGELVPGTFAATDELLAIGRAMRAAGHGVFQNVVEHTDGPKAFGYMRELAGLGVRVVFNLNQPDWAPELWRECLTLLDGCAADGLDVWAQTAGRSIGILMRWELTAHPFVTHPTFVELAREHRGDALRAALQRPDVRARILAEKPGDAGPFGNFIMRAFSKMYPQGDAIDYEPSAADSVAARAQREGRPPLEVAYDALCARDGTAFIYFPLFNYAYGDLSMTRAMHLHPRTRLGLSDAGAHCGAICDGGMPTFMLTHWTRDRTRGDRLPLPLVIQRQTRDTAWFYGLRDRGVLAPGYRADVNVIDYDRLGFTEPEVAHDLPAGGRRLVQRARGYELTMCAGVPIVERGDFTGALPGVLVRGPQSGPR